MNSDSTTPTGAFPKVTVLLVDDDRVDRMAVRRAFKRSGIANSIVEAQHGRAALDKLRGGLQNKPHVVLLDLNMPIMGGHAFLKALREDPLLRSTVVFVLTTSDDPGDIQSAYAMNVAGYIRKDNASRDFMRLTSLMQDYMTVVTLPQSIH